MTRKYDYKDTLEWMNEDLKIDRTLDQMLQPHTDTILHALKLADKLTGEPSQEAVMAAGHAYQDNFGTYLTRLKLAFKAMISQAQKEIEVE